MQLRTCPGSTHPGLETLGNGFHLCVSFSFSLQAHMMHKAVLFLLGPTADRPIIYNTFISSLCNIELSTQAFPIAAVPNLLGTRDQFHGRQFSHGQGGWVWRRVQAVVRAMRGMAQPIQGLGAGDPCPIGHEAAGCG